MAYTINKYDRTELVVLDDGTLDTSTSLGLVGRNYVGYGETQNENFVFLLENFANINPPTRPLKGQIWYNTSDNLTYVFNGTGWDVIGSAVLSETAPQEAHVGGLWFKTPANTLYVYNGTEWIFIGPESAQNFGITRARSTTLLDDAGNPRPVILLTVNNTILGICSSIAFLINPSNAIAGFNNLIAGITLSTLTELKGNVNGNASSADRLLSSRLINDVSFDGTTDITIKAATTNRLVNGSYLVGADFDGSTPTTWAVDATSSNVIGKVVARNSEGGFSAGTITASLIGNVTGNVNAPNGISNFDVVTATRFVGESLSGNAFTATKFETARKINGVNFDGTTDITVTASATSLTGTSIKDTVVSSSLTTLGTLLTLNVADAGINVGSGNQINILVEGGASTIRSASGRLNIDVGGELGPEVVFVNAPTALSLGAEHAPAMFGDNVSNIGAENFKFNKVYANQFKGIADSATEATIANNIVGGGPGSLVYQTSANTTGMLPAGANNYVLKSKTGNLLAWEPLAFERLTEGSYIKLTNTNTTADVTYYDTVTPITIAVEATSTSTINKIVARDANGSFSANTVTANLVGNVIGNLTGTVTGTVSGNAGTVTNGVYTTGAYSNPTWLTSLAGSKVTAIPNSSLVNSSIRINGTTVALGGSIAVSSGIGTNQTWIRQVPDRAFNVTYTNDTGNPIVVVIGCYHLSASAYNYYYVDDVPVGFSTGQGGTDAVGVGGTVTLIVPAGSTYKVTGGSKTGIRTWAELR